MVVGPTRDFNLIRRSRAPNPVTEKRFSDLEKVKTRFLTTIRYFIAIYNGDYEQQSTSETHLNSYLTFGIINITDSANIADQKFSTKVYKQ